VLLTPIGSGLIDSAWAKRQDQGVGRLSGGTAVATLGCSFDSWVLHATALHKRQQSFCQWFVPCNL
jgi:hypothetical protein